MSQTYALLLDAYRELNAKKLFWVSLVLSVLIVLVIAAIGINRQGYSIFGWSPAPFQNEMFAQMPPEALDGFRSDFYQEVFNIVGVQVWLTWAAIILAIFSTAGMFPDLMTSGSIDTLLSKPISRLRLFLTKYLLGLGFVGLQVAVFSVGAFAVVGLRAGDWEPKLFLAVPIVLLFFSYLYAVCVLVGVLTRSTLLAVIVTGLVWVAVFALNTTDNIMLRQQADAAVRADIAEQRLAYLETLPTVAEREAELNRRLEEIGQDTRQRNRLEHELSMLGQYDDLTTQAGYAATWSDAESLRSELEHARDQTASMGKWRHYGYLVKTPLPKTGETASLMTRALTDTEELADVAFDPAESNQSFYSMDPFGGGGTYQKLMEAKAMRLSREQRGWAWIVLTSILFEMVVVGFAAWRFCRRDY